MNDNGVAAVLAALLDGATYANVLRGCGRPCRVRLPNDGEGRRALVLGHLRGRKATLTFHADGHTPWQETVESVVLAAFCPAADGLCRWIGIDLDAADHGEHGLADAVHAMRTVAEGAAAAGLADGLLAARSRRGRGRHVFLLLREPVPLTDAVIGVAAIAAAAFNVASADTTEHAVPHVFRSAAGAIAHPGDAGAVELIPRSTERPPYGWALVLPAAGAFRAEGGGVIVDPFTDQPTSPERVPRCDCAAWRRFVEAAHERYSQLRPCRGRSPTRSSRQQTKASSPLDRIDSRTHKFLDGGVTEGTRNAAAFAASANLLGCGVDPLEAERLVLAGAAACGLPEREARAAFQSALKARARRTG